MDELKLIFASNLIRLRTAAGMTQAELGEQLNYSDKSARPFPMPRCSSA